MKTFTKDKLTVKIFPSRKEMGKQAASDIKDKIVELLKSKEYINMIFAAAPSQNEVLQSLVEDKEVDFGKINAFHMDEYIGLSKDAPQGFGNFLRAHLFGRVPFRSVNYIDCTAKNPRDEAERYSKLLQEYPADIVVLGIGENGHIAFNDPPVADFADKFAVKQVKLDEICRQQQVNDGCFGSLDDVPSYALTLTIPALTKASYMFCVVPALTKAKAVKETLEGKIGSHCPATVLRNHSNATLYLDSDSASLLQ